MLGIFSFCLSSISSTSFGQSYSADLDDIERPGNPINHIGDLGDLEKIVDLRGFIPLSLVSREKLAEYNDEFLKSIDIFQWYKVPIRSGVSTLYYGESNDATVKKLDKTKLIDEDGLAGEDLQWAKLAYELSRSSGPDLFKVAGGSRGLDSSEPVAMLFTPKTVIILMSFRYTGLSREGTGQILCGLEFSRALKAYKTYYDLYSTTAFSRSTKNAYSASAEYVTKALTLYFSIRQ